MPASKQNLLTDDHVSAIGALVVAVSKLESVVTELIALLSGMEVVSALITVHHQQLSSKISTLQALCRLGKEPNDDDHPLVALASQAGEIGGFRNTVVHAHWTVDASGIAYAVRFEARGQFVRKKRAISAPEIQQKAEEGDALAQRLAELRDYLARLSAEDKARSGTAH
jgi:hypothetical protein